MKSLNDVSETGSFALDLTKTFALSTAATAGTIGGLFVVGLVIEVNRKRKSKKAAKLVANEK